MTDELNRLALATEIFARLSWPSLLLSTSPFILSSLEICYGPLHQPAMFPSTFPAIPYDSPCQYTPFVVLPMCYRCSCSLFSFRCQASGFVHSSMFPLSAITVDQVDSCYGGFVISAETNEAKASFVRRPEQIYA